MTTIEPRPDVTVRTVTRADLLAVFRIEKRSFTQPWPYAAFEGFLDEPGFLVAVRGTTPDDTVLGYVVADTVPNDGERIGHIKDLAVDPHARERGIGSRLLERGLSILAREDVERVKLEVRRSNEAARRLYQRFGFEINHVRSGYYDDGEDALVMARSMDRSPNAPW